MLSTLLKFEVSWLTWLRYSAWIPLYPLALPVKVSHALSSLYASRAMLVQHGYRAQLRTPLCNKINKMAEVAAGSTEKNFFFSQPYCCVSSRF